MTDQDPNFANKVKEITASLNLLLATDVHYSSLTDEEIDALLNLFYKAKLLERELMTYVYTNRAKFRRKFPDFDEDKQE